MKADKRQSAPLHGKEGTDHPQRFSGPDQESFDHGTAFLCAIDRDRRSKSGKIYDESKNVCWTYSFAAKRVRPILGNPFGKPDFVLSNVAGEAQAVIRRVSFLSSRFEIRDQQQVIGRLQARRPFRIKYDIEIAPAGRWNFVMRLFTVKFLGYSKTRSDFWVMVGPSKMEWSILIRPGIHPLPLVASLAFIHNEWWNYG